MKKVLISGIIASALVLSPILASAQTATSSNVSTMLQQIQALQAQIKAMQDLQNQLKTAQQNVQTSLGLIRNLKQGMSGDDVKALQAILASDPSIFPNGQITGFFGRLTAEAVKKFQKKNGLEQVGNVGPRTLKKLNENFDRLGLSFENASSTGVRRDDNEGENDRGEGKRLCAKVLPDQAVAVGLTRRGDDENEGEGRGRGEDGRGFQIRPLPPQIGSTTNPIIPPCRDLPPPPVNPQVPPPQGSTTPPTPTPTPPTQPGFTLAQVATHNNQNDCYSVVNGSVYNLTSWISQHPGGASAIIGMCGKDGTASFMAQHGGQGNPAQELALFKIGILIQ